MAETTDRRRSNVTDSQIRLERRAFHADPSLDVTTVERAGYVDLVTLDDTGNPPAPKGWDRV